MKVWKVLLSVVALSSWKSASAVNPIIYEVEEEVQEGNLIGNIISGSGLATKYHPSVLSQLKYTFLTRGHTDLFSLGEHDGELRTAGRLDRDTICPGQEVCVVKMVIAVQPVQYFQVFEVIVKIEDINDNDPKFPSQKMKTEISEKSAPGSVLSIPIASDPDSPEYSIKRYELSVSGIFELQVTNSTDGTVELNLVLKERLDRENMEHYEMRVVAYDGGNPPRTGSLEIEITVLRDPKSVDTPYSIRVLENTPITIYITKVAADPGSGKVGEIEYTLSPQTVKDQGDTFRVQPNSAAIILTGPLDHGANQQYHLSVQATAKGTGADSTSTKVTVNVVAAKDTVPISKADSEVPIIQRHDN